jgi:hypothetical protein
MDEGTGFTIFGVGGIVLLCILCFKATSCEVATRAVSEREATTRNEQDQRTAQACIASQRTAAECALILHGTGSR